MNLVGIVLVVLWFTKHIDAAPQPCVIPDVKEKVCNETEYEAYRNCIEETKLSREKRQTIRCLPHVVEPMVQIVKPFEMLVPVEPLTVVRSPVLKSLDRTIIVRAGGSNQIDDDTADEEGSFHYRLPANMTTVIRLINIVNNTNHIHMPTTGNHTHVSNIHVSSNLSDVLSEDDYFEPDDDNCCTAVRPQSCHASTEGVRCKHRKFQTCGPQCTAKVVHIQKRKRCNRSTGDCQEKIAYVPQPEKPTCVYLDDWPYVACGKVANMSVICAGCYDHYGYGYEAVHGHSRMQPQCFGCYDDAFDVGQRYRRGPVLRPFYYHQAPCYLKGNCPDSYDDCGYGCYGHDRIDPAWGHPDRDHNNPSMDSSNTIYFDPDDLGLSNETSYDWGVPTAKCAVATDGNTITLKNCTDAVDNPYMAAPASHPYYHKLHKANLKDHSHRPHTSTTHGTEPPSTSEESKDDERINEKTTTRTTEPPLRKVTDPPTTLGVEVEDADRNNTTQASSSTPATEVTEGEKSTPTPAPTTCDDEPEVDEDYEPDASGDGMAHDGEGYFVEEYVDDEDFNL